MAEKKVLNVAALLFLSIVAPLVFATESKEDILADFKLPSKLNYTVTAWTPGLDQWNPPPKLWKELPFYIMGFDYEKRPVVVMEFGKWKTATYAERGPEALQAYDRYFEKFWHFLATLKSPHPDAEHGIFLILDMEGFTNAQMTNVAALQNHLVQARRTQLVEDNIAEFYLINLNFVANAWLTLLRSVAGSLVGRSEPFGTRKEVWIPKLRSKIPSDQLPPWYGGSKNFKPVKLFP